MICRYLVPVNFLEDNMHRAGWSFLRDDVSGKNIALNLCRSGSSPYLPDTDFLDIVKMSGFDEERLTELLLQTEGDYQTG